MRPMLLAVALGILTGPAHPQELSQRTPPRVLTTCHSAHDISVDEAAKGYPVHLHAVVTFYDPYLDPRHAALFVHDSTGSIFIGLPSRPVLSLRPGTLVDVTGITGTGDYAPVILHAQVKAVGTGSLPANAPRPSMAQLLSGSEDGQWIEIEGIIQSVRREPADVTFRIDTEGGIIPATGPLEPNADYARLVDARVRLRGNAVPVFNGSGQMVGARLLFPSTRQLTVVEPAPPDPYDAPIVPLTHLLRFTPGVVLRHRSHIRATVTLNWPGRLLCVQEGAHGLCMSSENHAAVRVGDLVDGLGFATTRDLKPTLDDATVRIAARSRPIAAVPVTIDEALRGGHDQQLVRIEGQLIGIDRATGDLTLELRSGGILYSALLPQPQSATAPWKESSLVRLTGVCDVLMDPTTSGGAAGAVQVHALRLLLRSAADVEVLREPSWWNPQRMLNLLAIVGILALAAIAWGVALRRKVEQQTRAIRENQERLRHLSQHDVLTGLPNRLLLNDRLEMAVKQSARSRRATGVLMVDLDRFKDINDNRGHRAGDLVLQEVARRLTQAVRTTDTVARVGGDEFIVVLPEVHDAADAELIAAKIVDCMTIPVAVDNERIAISASVGVTTSIQNAADPEQLLHQADAAMYQAKRAGRNRYQLAGSQTTSVAES